MAKLFDPQPGIDYLVDPARGCWLWTGHLSESGYAIAGGRTVSRLMLERAQGPIPLGHLACHTCDVRACINPDHLFAGTHGDNGRDMGQKNRGSKRTAHLNETQVKQVLGRYKKGETEKAIAFDLAVSTTIIRHIVQGKTWRPVYEAFHGLPPWPDWPAADGIASARTADQPLVSCAKLIRQRREELGLTQAELGHRLRSKANFISLIESGRASLPPKRILLLAQALELDEAYVVERVLAETDGFEAIHARLFGPGGWLRGEDQA